MSSIKTRDDIFKMKSTDFIGEDNIHEEAIWGVAMEIAYEEGSMTLLSLVDGTASLYFSNGGGVFGAGQHGHIAGLSSAIASGSGIFFSDYAEETQDFPVPETDHAHFYFFSDAKIMRTDGFSEDDLGEDNLPLSPLFHAMHMLIATIQEVDEE